VLEYGRAVVLDVVIEPNAMANPGQDRGQRRLADFERAAAEIVAVQFNQVEGIQEHAGVVSAVTDALKLGIPLSSQATVSPSMMQERERNRAKDSTINGKRYVRSLPGRL
jgi:hypothetical protein